MPCSRPCRRVLALMAATACLAVTSGLLAAAALAAPAAGPVAGPAGSVTRPAPQPKRASATAARPHRYTVRPGDSLSAIATRHQYRGGWPRLYAHNRRTVGSNPDLIFPGQVLRLSSPAPRHHRTPSPPLRRRAVTSPAGPLATSDPALGQPLVEPRPQGVLKPVLAAAVTLIFIFPIAIAGHVGQWWRRRLLLVARDQRRLAATSPPGARSLSDAPVRPSTGGDPCPSQRPAHGRPRSAAADRDRRERRTRGRRPPARATRRAPGRPAAAPRDRPARPAAHEVGPTADQLRRSLGMLRVLGGAVHARLRSGGPQDELLEVLLQELEILDRIGEELVSLGRRRHPGAV